MLPSMSDPDDAPRRLSRAQERELAAVSREAFAALRQRRLALLTELRTEGWTLHELAKLLGCTYQRIQSLLRSD